MIIHFLKFFHVLIALSLLGSTFFCLISVKSNKVVRHYLNKSMLGLATLAVITGSLLVHPEKFTFHTHWIMAAYSFVFLFALGVSLLIFLKKKEFSGKRLIEIFLYSGLVILLFIIIQDAVTKKTYLF